MTTFTGPNVQVLLCRGDSAFISSVSLDPEDESTICFSELSDRSEPPDISNSEEFQCLVCTEEISIEDRRF